VTIANLDRLVLPAVVQVEYQDGRRERIRIPAEAWIQKTTTMLYPESKQPIRQVSIDPDHVLPDENRANNVLAVAPH
jgi:hypothetical protein